MKPTFHDSDYVVVDGRALLRVRGGDGTEEAPLIDQMRERSSKLIEDAEAFVTKRQNERKAFEERDAKADDKPSDEERAAFAKAEEDFAAEFTRRKAEIAKLDDRIDEQDLIDRRAADAARASAGTGASVRSEPLTYRRDLEGKVSYFGDLAATVPGFASRMDDPAGAMERLQRHAKEMGEILPKRAADREARATREIDQAEREFRGSFGPGAGVERRGLLDSPFERRVNPNRTDGQGGYFVPPIYLIDEYIAALRAGRVAANLARNMTLPQGTDSINIPKVATTTTVGAQAADNAAVASQDLTDTVVSANVKTLAGQEDVALQLIEQSPGEIVDRVIMEDLMADYNRLVDRQVISGSGSSGQILGLLPASNWAGLGVTWTDATPAGAGHAFTHALGAMASKVSYNRFNLQSFEYLLHGRRWFWYATSLDGASGTSGRAIVNPADTGFNVDAIAQGIAAEGLVGRTPFGPNVNISPNVPTNDTTGGGSLQDVALAANWDDVWLFEGDLRTRVLSEVLSGTLQVRFQVYSYVTMLLRYGQSLVVATGSGFAAPVSAIDSSITF